MADTPSQQQTIGQYYLMEKIAQGGMAEIFKGLSYDVHGLKKTVCIKRILPRLAEDKEFIDSLIDEAKIAVRLVHGNIAQTFDLGKVGDDYFMVMEFVDGKSLSQIHKKCLAKGTMIPIPFLLYFITESLGGLDYIHRRTDQEGTPLNIVHRDISPQNIMVSFSGTVKIIDFGIAKSRFKAGSTDSGLLKGKFAYMSPEQAYGEQLDHRSDLFSLAVILHEMLTGKRLFKAEDNRQTIRNVRRTKVDPPSSFRGDIPEELDRIVLHGLAKDRRHRYGFASEMRDDLTKFFHRTYPEFQSSDAAAFVRELFADDIATQSEEDADGKTPHLIIDHTNSALADDSQFEATGVARAPVDMREYMLDEHTGPRRPEPRAEQADEEESQSTARRQLEDFAPSDEEDEHYDEAEEALEAGDEGEAEEQERTRRRWVPWVAGILGFGIAATIGAVLLTRAKTAPPHPGLISTFGEIMVVTDPSDARVLLDGELMGSGSPVTLRDVRPETDHVLAVQKEGFTPHERKLRLRAGDFLSFQVTLTPAMLPTGTILLETTPKGATVFLDDRETSHRTPATLDELKAGKRYRLGLYLDGHRFWSKQIELKGGETKTFDVQMTPDYGSVRVESEPTGALVVMGGVPVGQTPLKRDNLEPGRIYQIEVWHEGFEHAKREFKTIAGREETIRILLEREDTPAQREFLKRTKKRP